MSQLTPTEQEQVERACKAHQFRSKKETFQAGAAFALSELCQTRMVELLEWVNERYFCIAVPEDKNMWREWDGREELTTQRLLEKYFEHLKQKQDATK